MSLDLELLDAPFGAMIRGRGLETLSDVEVNELRDAVHDRLLIVFRDAETVPADSDLLRVATSLGEVNEYFKKSDDGRPEELQLVRIISNAPEHGAIGGANEIDWHTNISYQERCAAYTLLNAVELPEPAHRPLTYWVDLRAAYEAMPAALRARVSGQTVHYSQKGYHGKVAFDPSEPVPEAVNDLVRVHPVTSRPSLYEIGRRVSVGVVGMEQSASTALMDSLLEHATQPRFMYSHAWEEGDTIVWDNLSTLHRRDPWSDVHRRVMRVVDVLEAAPSGRPPEVRLGQILPPDWEAETAGSVRG